MRRREFVTLIGGVVVGRPLAARAQQPAMPARSVGVLMSNVESDPVGQLLVAAFRGALSKLGRTEGSNLPNELRWGAADTEKIRASAKELVDLQPDAILAHTTPVTSALSRETRKIPIVFAVVSDPIGSGFAGKPGASRRQHHRVHQPRSRNGRQMGGTVERDCATHGPRSAAVQTRSSWANPSIYAFHSSRCVVIFSSGNHRPGRHQGRDRRCYRRTSPRSGRRGKP